MDAWVPAALWRAARHSTPVTPSTTTRRIRPCPSLLPLPCSIIDAGMPQPVRMLKATAAESSWAMCMSVNAWSILAVGVALPTFILRELELHSRRQSTAPRLSDTAPSAAQLGAGALSSPWGGGAPEPSSWRQSLLNIYLLSCLLWAGVLAVQPQH